IGYLPSESGLYHRLTPHEVISLFGRLSGLKGNTLKRRVDELVESLGMQEFAHTRIEKLSTGMKQKVKVARTIIHDPPILILDEPTQGLDVPSSQIVEKFIKEERDKGKAIILSTHIMEEAEYLADRILVIHKGRKRAEGTMEELRKMTGRTRLKEVFLQLIKEDGA
ncbi:MAG TPA: ATP-binding cassette domain-containing protein, partial [candidate division WOR-3 bacterium]|nr:ATP-binding cassette domain-containing protein [candidate division WOR-3 bacterium]